MKPSRPAYAALLPRVFPDDLRACVHCAGDLKLIACFDDPNTIAKILRHLGLPTEVPMPVPARSPPQLAFDDWGPTPDDIPTDLN